MIQKCDNWPLVLPNDDGIRPAGDQDECFYCHKKVGKKHGPECCCVLQHVRADISVDDETVGQFDEYVPYFWDEEGCNFHWNGSSWCCDNAIGSIKWLDTPKAKEAQKYIEDIESDMDNCTCHYLEFQFEKVLDYGPFIMLRQTPPDAPKFTEKEVRP